MIRSISARVLPRHLHERLFRKRLSRERFVMIVQATLAQVFGRRIACHHCGQPLCKVLCFVRRGRIAVWGAHVEVVRVDFEDRLHLRFSHARRGECTRPPQS